MKGYKIDNNGFYIEDFIYNEDEDITNDIIKTPMTNSLYIPKWNGKEWIEGAAQEYIDSLTIQTKREPTEQEELINKLILDNINMQMQIDSLIQANLGGN